MKEVVIIGGGLGGMAAALALLKQGFKVSLFESNYRLGGKAGAEKKDENYEDHGFHIFPTWYVNIFKIINELEIQDNFIDVNSFHQIRKKGESPSLVKIHNFTSYKFALKNIMSGALPKAEMFLYYYSVADLLSQPYRRRAFLDQLSVNGFIRSRFYRTERISLQYQDLLLKFISVPSYRVSAMTTKIMLGFWVKHSIPMHKILKGDMERFFIQPFSQKLKELGCKIVLSSDLEKIDVDGSRIKSVSIRNLKSKKLDRIEVDKLILAIPPEKISNLIDDDVFTSAPQLAKINNLGNEPMAALNIYFKGKINGIPKYHVNLINSKYSITFIDVSQIWDNLNNTVLNIIASEIGKLKTLSDRKATSEIIEELRLFIPFENADIEKTFYQSHVNEPLVTNDVGSWHYRPYASTELKNLYLAGAYCRNHIDMTSMEGAVISGLKAAKQLGEDIGVDLKINIQKPKVYPRILFVLGKIILLPLVVFAKIAVLLGKD